MRVGEEQETRRPAALLPRPHPPTLLDPEIPTKPHLKPHPFPLLSPVLTRPSAPYPCPSGIRHPKIDTIPTANLPPHYASASCAAHVANSGRRMVEVQKNEQGWNFCENCNQRFKDLKEVRHEIIIVTFLMTATY